MAGQSGIWVGAAVVRGDALGWVNTYASSPCARAVKRRWSNFCGCCGCGDCGGFYRLARSYWLNQPCKKESYYRTPHKGESLF